MAVYQGRKYCRECKRKTLHVKIKHSTFLLGVLSFLTLGLFAPFWLLAMFGNLLAPWRCQTCGKARL